jgi:hypothetical protein
MDKETVLVGLITGVISGILSGWIIKYGFFGTKEPLLAQIFFIFLFFIAVLALIIFILTKFEN